MAAALADENGIIQYPAALASYDEVVADVELFRSTLEKFHFTLNTKLMTPIVGGQELNLHKLFVEVTSRGGIEKVIQDRRLKEIISSFSFPSTATNASFVVRRYYMSLLYHYERLYLFKLDGWTKPAPAPAPMVNDPTSVGVLMIEPQLPPQEAKLQQDAQFSPQAGQVVVKKRRTITDQLPERAKLAEIAKKSRPRVFPAENSKVFGVIDGKFEHGYLVSVQVGTDILRGFVYLPDGQCSKLAPHSVDKSTVGKGRRKRKQKVRMLDPARPKTNLSGYNFFFAEQQAKLKLNRSGKDREIIKMIGESWTKLTNEQKAVYQEIGARDRERYRMEMALYREKLKAGNVISNAVPIQQIPAGMAVPIVGANQQSPVDMERYDCCDTDTETDMEESPKREIGARRASMAVELTNGTPDAKIREEAGGAGPSEYRGYEGRTGSP